MQSEITLSQAHRTLLNYNLRVHEEERGALKAIEFPHEDYNERKDLALRVLT